jgi:protein associated with RNAse G/E
MRQGDLIWVRVFKADGQPHRWWQAHIEAIRDDCIITLTENGNPVYHNTERFPLPVYHQQWAIRSFYWMNRRHNLLEVYDSQGQIHELYADIISPINIIDGEIHLIDHELDVSQLAGEAARIVDEDEFAEAAIRYGYTIKFMEACFKLAGELVDLLASWQPAGYAKYE